MPASTDFVAFASGAGANVQDQSDYAASSAVAQGFQTGTAQSASINKALRQGTLGVAGLALFVADALSENVPDDGSASGLAAKILAAIQAVVAGIPPSGSAGGDLDGTYPDPSLAPNGVAAGEYATPSMLTVDAKGRVSAITGGKIQIIGAGALQASGNVTSSEGVIFPSAFPNGCDFVIPIAGGQVNSTKGGSPILTANNISASGCTINGDSNTGQLPSTEQLTFNQSVPFTYIAYGH